MVSLVLLSGVSLAGDYSVKHKMEGYVTMMQVVAPEGATCHVKSDSSWFGEKDFEIPFKFKAQDKFYYTFDCKLPTGEIWHKKLSPKANYTNIITIGDDLENSAPVKSSDISTALSRMSSSDFSRLLKSLKEADFQDDKIRVLRLGVKNKKFSVNQVCKLVDTMDFEEGKIKVVELVAKQIVDPGNNFQILDHFTFSDGKQQAEKLLNQ
jgi:hypothetical protein